MTALEMLAWIKSNYYTVIIVVVAAWAVIYGVAHYFRDKNAPPAWWYALLQHLEFPMLMVVLGTALKVAELEKQSNEKGEALLSAIAEVRSGVGELSEKTGELASCALVGKPLNTTAELFGTLIEARRRAQSEIFLMQIRSSAPATVCADGSLDYKSDCAHLQAWYDGLAAWCLDHKGTGQIIRVTTDATAEMRAYNEAVDRKMKSQNVKNWSTVRLAIEPRLPMVNVCIFDGREVVITTAQPGSPQPYSQLKGYYVKDAELARLLRSQYFEPLMAAGFASGPDVAEQSKGQVPVEKQ